MEELDYFDPDELFEGLESTRKDISRGYDRRIKSLIDKHETGFNRQYRNREIY